MENEKYVFKIEKNILKKGKPCTLFKNFSTTITDVIYERCPVLNFNIKWRAKYIYEIFFFFNRSNASQKIKNLISVNLLLKDIKKKFNFLLKQTSNRKCTMLFLIKTEKMKNYNSNISGNLIIRKKEEK